MYDRSTLEKMTSEKLEKLAESLDLNMFIWETREQLIDAILTSQMLKNDGLGVSERSSGPKTKNPTIRRNSNKQKPKPQKKEKDPIKPSTEEDSPVTVNKADEKSGFITQNDDQSGFVKQNSEQSGFITQNDDQSGFVKQNNEQSGFITQNDDQSGFVKQNNEQSGFITQNDDQSGFVKQNHEQSGFITQNDDQSGFVKQNHEQSGFVTQHEDPSGVSNNQAISNEKSKVHKLGAGDEIELNGQKYLILEIISQSSGEAVIYKVQNNKNVALALKLYYENRNQKQEPNAEALTRISEIVDEDVLRLHDFGTGKHKFRNKYCFEVSDFAEGGNLLEVDDFKSHYTPEFIEQSIVPEVFKGIRSLHTKRIFHCDLKPRNIFYLNANKSNLVIGDYGSAKTFEEGSRREAQQFSHVIGTHAYLAPEQARGIISEKIDYYSFGMVLLHLLYPEHFAKDDDFTRVDQRKLRNIIERQYSHDPIIPFNPAYKRLNNLIEGLTLFNHTTRWGQAEINDWIAGKRVTVRQNTQLIQSAIKLGYDQIGAIEQTEDLVRLIQMPDIPWYKDLILDTQGFGQLLGWMANRYNLQQKKLFEKMVLFYKPEGKAFVQEAILRYFEPGRPVELSGRLYNFYNQPELEKEVYQFINDLDDQYKQLSLETLRLKLFQFEFALRQALPTAGTQRSFVRDTLEKVSGFLGTENPEDFTDLKAYFHQAIPVDQPAHALSIFLSVIYLFNPQRSFKGLNNETIEDPEALGLFFAANKGLFEHPLLKAETQLFLRTHGRQELLGLGYEELLFRLFEDKTQVHFGLKSLEVDSDRAFTTRYTYQRSLANFFKRQNINNALMEGSKTILVHKYDKGFFESTASVFKHFLKEAQQQHNIPSKVLEDKNIADFKKQFKNKALKQLISHHLSEILAVCTLLIPLGIISSLFILKNGTGDSIFSQLYLGTGMDLYLLNPEKHYRYIGGFFVVLACFALIYLFALIPKIWTRKRYEIFGEVDPRTPHLLSIRSVFGIGFLAFMALMPFLFAVTNWMFEIFGILVLLFLGGFLIRIRVGETKGESGSGSTKRKVIGSLLILAALARIGFEIWSLNELGMEKGLAMPYRGWIDLSFYLLALAIFFLPPIGYQFFKIHHSEHILTKLGIGIALLAVFVFQGNARSETYNVKRFFPTSETAKPLLMENTYLGQITVDFSAMNLRSGPGTDNDILTQIKRGQYFAVKKGQAGNWWQVWTCEGLQGYLYFDKVQLKRRLTTFEWEKLQEQSLDCSNFGKSGRISASD